MLHLSLPSLGWNKKGAAIFRQHLKEIIFFENHPVPLRYPLHQKVVPGLYASIFPPPHPNYPCQSAYDANPAAVYLPY